MNYSIHKWSWGQCGTKRPGKSLVQCLIMMSRQKLIHNSQSCCRESQLVITSYHGESLPGQTYCTRTRSPQFFSKHLFHYVSLRRLRATLSRSATSVPNVSSYGFEVSCGWTSVQIAQSGQWATEETAIWLFNYWRAVRLWVWNWTREARSYNWVNDSI